MKKKTLVGKLQNMTKLFFIIYTLSFVWGGVISCSQSDSENNKNQTDSEQPTNGGKTDEGQTQNPENGDNTEGQNEEGKTDDQPTTIDDSKYSQPVLKTIGDANSGFTFYGFEKGGFTYTGNIVTDTNYYLGKYQNHVNELVNNLNNSLDENTKNYFSSYLNAVQQNTYNNANLDQVIETNYNNGAYIYNDIISAIPLTDTYGMKNEDKVKFAYGFEAMSNYAYGKSYSLDTTMSNKYSNKMKSVRAMLESYGMTNLTQDIGDNKCTKIASEVNRILGIAVTNLNSQRGINVSVEQLQQLMNITMTAKSMENIHDIHKDVAALGHNSCGIKLTLDSTMENTAINSLSASTSVAPNYEMGL
ncbi:MAG: hypothetical protein IJ558_04030 [Treponema sp.]|nr:hypothetical protein [Treponema sp.]